QALLNRTKEALGSEKKTFTGEVFQALETRRLDLWREQVKKKINWELFNTGMETFTWLALEELVRAAQKASLVDEAPRGSETAQLIEDAVQAERDLGKTRDRPGYRPFAALQEELTPPFAKRV